MLIYFFSTDSFRSTFIKRQRFAGTYKTVQFLARSSNR